MSIRIIGSIGAGNMATAIFRGLLAAKRVTREQLLMSDVADQALAEVKASLGIRTTTVNKELVELADCVMLSVKPQVIDAVLADCSREFSPNKLLVSICAGVTTQALEEKLPKGTRVVRVMPNTPALVGAGASAVAPGKHATQDDTEFVRDLFSSVGLATTVAERYMDAVTGLSGSGPAFIMLLVEALADGGVRSGLPRQIALQLATQTVFGAAKLVRDTKEHPAVLKDKVTSPAGTTIEGVFTLEQHGFRAAVADAVCAATRRSKELGE